MKQISRLPIIAILLVTLTCGLFLLIAMAFFSYQTMTSQAIAPYVSIVNNNLGAKTKLLHIKSALQDFLVQPTPSNLGRTQTRTRIMRASIINDLKSHATIELHSDYGDFAQLDAMNQGLQQLTTAVTSLQDVESAKQQMPSLIQEIDQLYDRWNSYTSNVILRVEHNQSDFLLSREQFYHRQHWYYLAIIAISILIIALVFKLYIDQVHLTKLTQEQALEMKEAKKAAEASADIKSKFLANISHEVRTPLNAIIGLSDTDHYLNASEQIREYIDLIHRSGKHLLALMNDILDVSKIDSGKLSLNQTEFSLKDMIDDTRTLFHERTHNPGVESFILTPQESDMIFYGDALRIFQIISNLCSNAIKFTHQGHIKVEFAVQNRGPNSVLQILVSDTGIGMSDAQLKKVFDEFVQADDSTTRKYGGTGLGLAICQKLTELMQGSLRIESELNRGTQISLTLTLPLLHAPHIEPKPPSPHDIMVHNDGSDYCAILQHDINRLAALAEHSEPYFIYYHSNQRLISNVLPTLHEEAQGRKIIVITDIEQQENVDRNSRVHYLSKPYVSYRLFDLLAGRVTQTFTPLKVPHRTYPELHVLLVEDVHINQLVATHFLSRLGITPDVVNNGEEALNYLRKHRYDLVLMDIQMPVMDGLQAMRVIKTEQLGHHTVFIAVTANVFEEDQQKYRQAGFDDLLAKPFNLDALQTIIDTHCHTQLVKSRTV
ncbi:ATP-binding protein [Vibrio sp. IRLE0018]|uniref:ATP-binding protein n=1 Tax=Vibrio floridensis TaxID=2908007 RepID=UPI001F2DFFE0|nr:ATP-binding protein [Vibrio floridensis]MCF8779218.1 ATP-binding protein [Vibrio floridensis]